MSTIVSSHSFIANLRQALVIIFLSQFSLRVSVCTLLPLHPFLTDLLRS